MRVERIATRQGHPVPATAHSPKGPFPPELFASGPIISDYVPQGDNGGDSIPLGATAQNNFSALNWFTCKVCDETIAEHEIPSHLCEE